MGAEMDALSLLKRDHELVKDLMKRIEKEERDTKARAAMFEPDDERWPAKFTVMKENVEHHIQEEEEKLFPKAEKLLGDKKLGELGAKMADLKEAERQALAEQLEEGEAEQEAKR